MKATKPFDVTSLPSLYTPDRRRIRVAEQRQADVFAGRKPDKWPLLIGGKRTAAQEKIPAPTIKEAFYDSDLMLCYGLRSAAASANTDSDVVPSIRANMGTGILMACLGLEQELFAENEMPWLKCHLTKAEIMKLTPGDIKIQGSFELGLRHMKRFREIMGDSIPVFCMDTQGPYDLAHLLLGDDLFLEMYDDPPFVHHLMDLVLALSIKAHTLMKEISGEPLNHVYHSNSYYGANMGIRICEDTTVLIGEDAINTFAMPYTARLARHFGGAWIHYCGRNDGLTRALCGIPEIRGINFGHVPGKVNDVGPERFKKDMDLLHKSGKVYVGAWPLYPGESGKEYLDRIHKYAAIGAIIPVGNAALGKNGFGSEDEALAYWHGL